MVSQREKLKTESMPELDDGWWASVLADEERLTRSRLVRTPSGASSNGGRTAAPRAVRDTAVREMPACAPTGVTTAAAPSSPPWEYARELYRRDEIVSLQVTGYNRGGLLVEGDGLRGFVPFSHLIDLIGRSETAGREQLLAAYVGRTLRLKVIECVPEDGRIVLSERAALTGTGRRMQLFNSLRVGQRLQGEVTNVTDFGVFVDLGGVEGLIHISELSWGRVAHPSQIAQVGQRLEVLVIDLAPERCRVALSLKRLTFNPWLTAEQDYRINDVVPAVITTLVSFGAFARLESGLEGLIHVSEMDLPEGGSVRDLLHEGQPVQVRILLVDAAHQRLGLSLRLKA